MNNPNKYIFEGIKEYLITKAWIPATLVCGLLFFYKLYIEKSFSISMGYSLIPIGILILTILITQPEKGFFYIFISNFLFLAINNLTDIKLGVSTFIFTLFIFILLIIKSIYKKIDWKYSNNGMLVIFLLWSIFCILEIANPNNVMSAWSISITHYAVYPLVCAILLPMAIKNERSIHWLLIIWSFFVIYATFKGYWQKNHGFNEKELCFLYELGGAKTHIIYSGIRFFSIFTDAANYGVHMAMAATGFGISIFYTKNNILKIYYAIIVIMATYSMFISGTRAAAAVPIAGLAFFTLLSRNKKAKSIGALILIIFICFFKFTNIGNSNSEIYRMRSAFSPTKDASYQVRQINKQNMKILMKNKPFGYGIGLAKGERFHPKEIMPYPPDSWLISVWVETGIIGLCLYLFIHCILFAWCSWIIMFKIKNKRLRGLLAAWLCVSVGFFAAAYVNDVMQYPNSFVFYTSFALCFFGPFIDSKDKDHKNSHNLKINNLIIN